MLKLVDIVKDYKVGDGVVEALKGVSITFRNNEFVSILGPSGCGKTTLLNIIGGLDHATNGELFIDGISTKNFKDRDYDNYRNKRIGFVFQSYNLIPHQTVLKNVELALTISGVKKEERVQKSKEILAKVGLINEINKKPNQLSGGQCQRVAIARALVNDPEILLADEPTGALDTTTSIQIMELLKEVAKDKLVIMVTHNPELANKYSTRIIKLLDGKLIDDSNPIKENEVIEESSSDDLINKKSKLSFFQAFKLSLQNLISKSKRSILICFASSIGIIGIGAVLSVSTGVNNYILESEEDMLNSAPLSISESSYDFSALMGNMTISNATSAITNNFEDGKININGAIDYIVNQTSNLENMQVTNDISREYLEYVYTLDEDLYNAINVSYGINYGNNIYTSVELDTYGKNDLSLNSILYMYGDMLSTTDYSNLGSFIDMVTYEFGQIPPYDDFILSQYDVIATSDESTPLSQDEDELVLVLEDDGSISDLFLTQFGFYSQDEFFKNIYHSMNIEGYEDYEPSKDISIDTLLSKEFYYYPNDAIYEANTNLSTATYNPFIYKENRNEISQSIEPLTLKIKTILKKKEGINYGALESGIYYSSKLTDKFLEDNVNSEVVLYLSSGDEPRESYTSMAYTSDSMTLNTGITYTFDYVIEDTAYNSRVGFVGSSSSNMAALLGQSGISAYTLTKRNLGGVTQPSSISIYPKDFNSKDEILEYLDIWNSDETLVLNGVTIYASQREEITITDNLSLIFEMVNMMTSIVTYALVAFTCLSLVVSTVMISIITYVSVIERIKEIGVIRSLGGRKRDVSNLFNAETFILGGIAGIIGVGISYLISGIINLIVGSMSGIYTIATLPIPTALILILVSIALTLVSGLIPASIASRKDPVIALRSE